MYVDEVRVRAEHARPFNCVYGEIQKVKPIRAYRPVFVTF